jgi:hypothetical protein
MGKLSPAETLELKSLVLAIERFNCQNQRVLPSQRSIVQPTGDWSGSGCQAHDTTWRPQERSPLKEVPDAMIIALDVHDPLLLYRFCELKLSHNMPFARNPMLFIARSQIRGKMRRLLIVRIKNCGITLT